MKALLLDLDDTLLDERLAVHQALAALLAAHRGRLPSISDDRLLKSWWEISIRHWKHFEQGEVSFQEQRRGRMRDFLGEAFTDSEADQAFEPYRRVYEASWRLFGDTKEFLVRTEGIPRVILTNGDREQQLRKVQITGLSGHLTAVVTPIDCGSWKPDHGIFLAGAALAGADPAHCTMIGDDDIRDIEPARRLGMQAFRVDGHDPERTLLKALEQLRF